MFSDGKGEEMHTTLSPRRRKRNIQRPLLPTNLFLALGEPRLPPLLLKELHRHQSSKAIVSRAEVGRRV